MERTSQSPVRTLVLACVAALVTISLVDWLAMDLLHREIVQRRRAPIPSCFARVELWELRFWLYVGLDEGVRLGRETLIALAAGGLALCRLALPRRLSRAATRALWLVLLVSCAAIFGFAAAGALELREALTLTPLTASAWTLEPRAPDVLSTTYHRALTRTGLAAVCLGVLSTLAVCVGALKLWRGPVDAAERRCGWSLLALFLPALMVFGALSMATLETVINRPRAPIDDYERWTMILANGRWLAVAATMAVAFAAWRRWNSWQDAGRGRSGAALAAVGVATASALFLFTAPHRSALNHFYKVTDPGPSEHELRGLESWTLTPPRVDSCTDTRDRMIAPLIVIAEARDDELWVELRDPSGDALVVDDLAEDEDALEQWLFLQVFQRPSSRDDEYCGAGSTRLFRRAEQQLEVLILAEVGMPLEWLDPIVTRVAAAAEVVDFGVVAAAESGFPSEHGTIARRSHCATGWFSIRDWRVWVARGGTWGELARSRGLSGRFLACG